MSEILSPSTSHILSQPYSTNSSSYLHPSFSSSIQFMNNTFTTISSQLMKQFMEQYFHNNFITKLSSQLMNNTFTTISSQQFHHNLWNNLWTILSQLMNHTSTHFHKLHRKIYFNKFLIRLHHNKLSDKLVIHSSSHLITTSTHHILHHNFNSSHLITTSTHHISSQLQHKHFNNAS